MKSDNSYNLFKIGVEGDVLSLSSQKDTDNREMATIENCFLIRRAVGDGLGKPEVVDGKCAGYAAGTDDEPYEICKYCKLNIFYECE